MSETTSLRPQLQRAQWGALLAGVAGLALCALGAVLDPNRFFQSYLVAYLYWIGMALGSIAVVMLHHLAGGEWGLVVRRPLEAAAMTLPVMAFAFVPLALALPVLYEWARPEAVAANALLQHKAAYLNVPFFVLRAVAYFAAWIGMAYWLYDRSRDQDRAGSPLPRGRVRLLSGLGLVLLALTVTFAAFDWGMSLEPEWFSTIYGMMLMVGQVLGAFAFGVAVVALLEDHPSMSDAVTPSRLNDLGSLLLTFVLLWAYIAYSQYIVIWSGDLPEEAAWYLRRTGGGWGWVVIALLVAHFLLPFAVLLSRRAKRRAEVLLAVAALVVVMRWVDTFWLVIPAFHPGGISLHWLDLATLVGVGGIWLAAFVWFLKRRPLVPVFDPRLRPAEAEGEARWVVEGKE